MRFSDDGMNCWVYRNNHHPLGTGTDSGRNYRNVRPQKHLGGDSARLQTSSFPSLELGTIPVRKLPPFSPSRHSLVYAYMLAKYTSRWKFYRTAAILCNSPHFHLVREVVNPSKDHNLDEVASRHQIDPVEFKRVKCQLRRMWPLLP